MKEGLIEEIKSLIEEKMGVYKKEINSNTTLEFDLGISGTDASELLLEYGKRFNVNVSNFNMAVYFLLEGDTIFPSIIRFFTGKKPLKQKELTIGDLKKGILAGRLDEEVING